MSSTRTERTRWNYTLNVWEWDKHPSFSPDSQKIVFWSNREGTKQIYVMDANGRNLKKIFAHNVGLSTIRSGSSETSRLRDYRLRG